MAEKLEVVSLQFSNSIKIQKWKVNEGYFVSIGTTLLIYDLQTAVKKEQRKLKSARAGSVHKLLANEGAIVNPGEPLMELKPCIHPTVMKDMCAECGADLRKEEIDSTASVPMIHSVPDLKVSKELAQKIGKADEEHLIHDRKLVLLVDLDQTLIHTTNDIIPPNIKDVYHFRLYGSPWYHTRLRPGTHQFLKNISPYFELHICTFGARNYAHKITQLLDPDGRFFSNRVLSRDECFNPTSKTANLSSLFPCGDHMVCIIDDREDVWSFATNLIHVKPYHFFQHTGDINAPPGLDKHEDDEKVGVDLSKIVSKDENNSSKTEEDTQGEGEMKDDEKFENGDSSEETDKKREVADEELVDNDDDNDFAVKDDNKRNKEIKVNGSQVNMIEESNENTEENSKLKPSEDKLTNEEDSYKTACDEEESNKTACNEEETNKTACNEEESNKTACNEEESNKTACNEEESNKTACDEEDSNKTACNEEESNKTACDEEESNKTACDEEESNKTACDEEESNKTACDEEESNKTACDEEETNKTACDEEESNKTACNEELEREVVMENKEGSSVSNDENKENNIKDHTKSSLNSSLNLIEIEDPDDYLLYLEDILKRIHKTFYEHFDMMESGVVPDLKKIIPEVKSRVLKNLKLCFSGLVPTHIKLEQSKAYQIAKSLGAEVTQDLQEDTTHLVAVRRGTAKVNAGRRKKNLHIVTPDWLWACAERWRRASEKLYPLSSKGSKNRHPPPHCSSPEHAADYGVHNTPAARKRTDSGRFMDTINPLMSFSTDDIADMDKEVEDLLEDGDSESEREIQRISENREGPRTEDNEMPVEDYQTMTTTISENAMSESSSEESITAEMPRGHKRPLKRKRRHDVNNDDNDDSKESSESDTLNVKFRRGENIDSELDMMGGDSNSEGSMDAPDEIDDGEWNMMGAALEREFLSNN